MAQVQPLLDDDAVTRTPNQPGNRGSGEPTYSNPGGPVRPAAPAFDPSRVPQGVPQDWAQDFLNRNPGDYHRIQEAYTIPTTHRPYDSQSGNQNEQAANRQADMGMFTSPRSNPFGSLTGAAPLNLFGGQNGINMPGGIFDDPTSRLLEDLLRGRIGQLTQPVNDPLRGQYQSSLQQTYDRFSQPQAPTPVPGGGQTSQDQYRAALQQQIARFMNPSADENALTDAMLAQFQELSQSPGYSQAERAMLNTQAFEPIEALRKASQERERERTSAAGYLPTSGVHNARMTSGDRFYDQMRTTANRDLAVQEIDRRDADLLRALTVGSDLAEIPIARGQSAIDASGSLQGFDQGQSDRQDQRSGQASTIAGLLAALSQGARTEDDARQGQAIQLGTQLRQMPMQALAQAMGVLNGTAPPETLLPAMMQLAQSGQNQNQQFYAMLGQLASLFD